MSYSTHNVCILYAGILVPCVAQFVFAKWSGLSVHGKLGAACHKLCVCTIIMAAIGLVSCFVCHAHAVTCDFCMRKPRSHVSLSFSCPWVCIQHGCSNVFSWFINCYFRSFIIHSESSMGRNDIEKTQINNISAFIRLEEKLQHKFQAQGD